MNTNKINDEIKANNNNIDLNNKLKNVIINSRRDKKNKKNIPKPIKEPKKSRRPVYKIPPSKKRSISQGKSLQFIHKYYDENFILEEENENDDNISDEETDKLKTSQSKKIFEEVKIQKISKNVDTKTTRNAQKILKLSNIDNDNKSSDGSDEE